MKTHSLKQMRVPNTAGHFEWSPLIPLCVGENMVVVLKAYDVAKMSMFWRRTIPHVHNRTWRQRAAWRGAG